MSDSSSSIEAVLDRLPIFDGAGRRRFVSGGVLLIGLVLLLMNSQSDMVVPIETLQLIGTPTLTLAAVLIVYSIGTVIDMLGEFFIVRAAAGAYGATTETFHRALYAQSFRERARGFGQIAVLPVVILVGTFKALFDSRYYAIRMSQCLSEEASNRFLSMPSRVRLGLQHPVSDDSDFAFKYLIDSLKSDFDRKWGRLLLHRTRDLLSITTSLFLIGATILFVNLIGPDSPIRGLEDEFEDLSLRLESMREAMEDNAFVFRGVDTPMPLYPFPESATPAESNRAPGFTAPDDIRKIEAYLEDTINYIVTAVTTDDGDPIDDEASFSEWNDDRASSASYEFLSRLHDSAASLLADYGSYADTLAGLKLARNAMVAGLTTLLLFVYVGFFTSQRNAVVNILETLALQGS